MKEARSRHVNRGHVGGTLTDAAGAPWARVTETGLRAGRSFAPSPGVGRVHEVRRISVGPSARCAGWLDWAIAAVMALLLPIAPFAAAAIARDWRYVRGYRATLSRAVGHLGAQIRTEAITRYVGHARGRVALPEGIAGSCTHCGNCCLERRCIFLDWNADGQSRCRIYGSGFWKRLACGRYPRHGLDIALYRCPGFLALLAIDDRE
jgi:hypothetical protein